MMLALYLATALMSLPVAWTAWLNWQALRRAR